MAPDVSRNRPITRSNTTTHQQKDRTAFGQREEAGTDGLRDFVRWPDTQPSRLALAMINIRRRRQHNGCCHGPLDTAAGEGAHGQSDDQRINNGDGRRLGRCKHTADDTTDDDHRHHQGNHRGAHRLHDLAQPRAHAVDRRRVERRGRRGKISQQPTIEREQGQADQRPRASGRRGTARRSKRSTRCRTPAWESRAGTAGRRSSWTPSRPRRNRFGSLLFPSPG